MDNKLQLVFEALAFCKQISIFYSAQAEGRGPSLKMQFVCFFFGSTSGHTVADRQVPVVSFGFFFCFFSLGRLPVIHVLIDKFQSSHVLFLKWRT